MLKKKKEEGEKEEEKVADQIALFINFFLHESTISWFLRRGN